MSRSAYSELEAGITRMGLKTLHQLAVILQVPAYQLLAVAIRGQNGQIPCAGKQDQQVADACKHLVQKVIMCWNCLYLNQHLFLAPAAERQQVADAIAASSPVSWQHINLHGEFDFSEALKDSLRFDIQALFAFNWEQALAPSD